MKIDKSMITLGIGSVCVIGAVWLGFDETSGAVDNCLATVSTYVTAEYSETITETSTDTEGNLVTSSSIEYSSEPASEVYTAVTVNGALIQSTYNFDTTVKYAAYYPPMPEYNTHLSTDFDFNNFKFHTDATLTVYATLIDGSITKFNDPITSNASCIVSLDSDIIIKTWYGMTYGSDF